MITVTLYRDDEGFIRRFAARGHAGYAKSGSDIICSAVTAVLTTAIGSLEDLAGIEIYKKLDDGHIECLLPDNGRISPDQHRTAMVILESMALGCRQIGVSYGNKYVQVKERTFV